MIATLIAKDLKLYARNRLYSFLTVFALLAYIGIYFLVPASTNEELSIGLALEVPQEHPLVQYVVRFMEPQLFTSREALLASVEEGEVTAGLVITREVLARLQQGQAVNLPLYVTPGTPSYLQEALADVVAVAINDLVSPGGGRMRLIEETEEVLGPDLMGASLSMRQRLLPMLVMFVLLIEAFGMATLINQEVVTDTVRALLVTPLRTSQFIAGKALLSVGLAITQVLILLVATGQIVTAPLQLLVLILLGGLFMTGVAFLIAAIARDYMGVFTWGLVFVLPMMLPGLTVAFPGMASAWMEWIPSFFLVDGLHRALNFQVSWGELSGNLVSLLGISLLLLALGGTLLRRRFQ
mgnify:CR=1 FL=1